MYIHLYKQRVFGIVIVWWGYGMVFHATFDNISVISWWSVLLAEETDHHDITEMLSKVG